MNRSTKSSGYLDASDERTLLNYYYTYGFGLFKKGARVAYPMDYKLSHTFLFHLLILELPFQKCGEMASRSQLTYSVTHIYTRLTNKKVV